MTCSSNGNSEVELNIFLFLMIIYQILQQLFKKVNSKIEIHECEFDKIKKKPASHETGG